MFTAIIKNEGNTLVMEFPYKRYLMADRLGFIVFTQCHTKYYNPSLPK